MWDLIVSVPDHCLSFYFVHWNMYETEYRTPEFTGPVLLHRDN